MTPGWAPPLARCARTNDQWCGTGATWSRPRGSPERLGLNALVRVAIGVHKRFGFGGFGEMSGGNKMLKWLAVVGKEND